MNRSNKTQKKKTKVNTSKLWTLFEEDMPIQSKKKHMACIYSKDVSSNNDISTENEQENQNDYNNYGNGAGRECCDLCKSAIMMSQEGFFICTNDKCGVIFKDYLDDSAEWRYYGANDNQHSDPTRCGMPVNPLLKESSYGCKVICAGSSSYEMKKISPSLYCRADSALIEALILASKGKKDLVKEYFREVVEKSAHEELKLIDKIIED